MHPVDILELDCEQANKNKQIKLRGFFLVRNRNIPIDRPPVVREF
jgi:hypothetical protein